MLLVRGERAKGREREGRRGRESERAREKGRGESLNASIDVVASPRVPSLVPSRHLFCFAPCARFTLFSFRITHALTRSSIPVSRILCEKQKQILSRSKGRCRRSAPERRWRRSRRKPFLRRGGKCGQAAKARERQRRRRQRRESQAKAEKRETVRFASSFDSAQSKGRERPGRRREEEEKSCRSLPRERAIEKKDLGEEERAFFFFTAKRDLGGSRFFFSCFSSFLFSSFSFDKKPHRPTGGKQHKPAHHKPKK